MIQAIHHFKKLLHLAFSLFANEKSDEFKQQTIDCLDSSYLKNLLPKDYQNLSFEEEAVFLLALMPHISPESLDLFFIQNKELDRPYTQFGGWQGKAHYGFLPTLQTAVFIIEKGKRQEEKEQTLHFQFSIFNLLIAKNIIRLEGQEDEPFLSNRLLLTDDVLAKLYNRKNEQEYNASFPAKRITTLLNWEDLVLPYSLQEELADIICWIQHQSEIRKNQHLNRLIKQGYRCLFYGPPGTGKTLTTMLLGKQNEMEVYRVDLSMIVSKYIGETEKNLAKVFDKAEHQNWILFFDEADALFGQRTDAQSSNDRHANQEVAYLLQRIEDFPGIVILASNLKENIDEAFFRRFQSTLYFPMPDQRLRYELWKKMLPEEWILEQKEDFLHQASSYKLSGGSMLNIIQRCAIKLHGKTPQQLTFEIFQTALRKEQQKEGKMLAQ